MAKIQPVWALDVGQAALKALKLVPSDEPDKVVAEAFDYIEHDKILSQPDADPEELVRSALTTFLERNDVKGCKIVLGVSGQSGLVKFIKLPPVEKKRIPDIVKFEARQQIPFALEEVIWDYQQIGGQDDGEEEEFTMAEVGLFAMKRDQILRAILPLKNAGIEVDQVQMGPIALYNFAAFDQLSTETEDAAGSDQQKQKGSVVYLDIGADNTDLIITDGTRIWQRNVPIGGNHFTRALTKELKLTFSKAEHLKKNATKAPDPRAVFTAMRGIFNDFSSEVSRSIGFYSSMNRQAKIEKVVGLGNGFKLPGLQKFLEQSLNYPVSKLEQFQQLTGEEVTSAPQFTENVPSFAVAYGLGLQGLGKGLLRTNLLPMEIQQTRLIRKKKPWALVAAALLMLGAGVLFLSDWRAFAKTKAPEFESAVSGANSIASRGKQQQSDFDKAKTEFEAVKTKGEALVGESTDTTDWPALLQIVSRTLPNPARELNLDPDNPKNVPVLDQLRVHIDEIVPVWREDTAVWFNDELGPEEKKTMHPIDRETAPTGPGWIVQIIGHHYNPSPLLRKPMSEEQKKFAFGPLAYLQKFVLPRFWRPDLRMLGINHAALTFFNPDEEWTTAKGRTGDSVPLLTRELPKAEGASTLGGGGRAGASDMASTYSAQAGQQGGAMYGMGGGGRGAMGGDEDTVMMGGGGMARSLGGGRTGPATKDQIKTLSRTKFCIQFVWQPVDPKSLPKSEEEAKTKLAEVTKQLEDAFTKAGKDATPVLSEEGLAAASREAIQKRVREINQQIEGAGAAVPAAPGAAPPQPPAAAPPGTAPAEPPATPPAPGSGATPPAPPANPPNPPGQQP
jgi:type IV pilus assembly protein PilM